MSTNEDRPDLFTSVLELIGDHGTDAILEALAMHSEFESQDGDVCIRCRLISGWLHLELEQLEERMIHFEDALDSFLESGYQPVKQQEKEP
jgi:hypothetical protein